MQTLHLRFRDLRAISLGQRPGRWPTPSMPRASTWKGAQPLPNHPEPTSAVGSPPKPSHQRLDRRPASGAGLPLASPFREAWIGASAHCDGPSGADPCRVCRGQTASDLTHDPAPRMAGDHGSDHLQARASESRWLTSNGPSFPLRPRRCGARASGEKTADPEANVRALARVSIGAHQRRLSSAGG